MPSPRPLTFFLPAVAVAFAAGFVALEYWSGGVKTHHFLGRRDLPGFSNWLSLFILPVLGLLVAFRAESLRAKPLATRLPVAFVAAAAGSLVYGTALAASFLYGHKQVVEVLFFGLFLVAIAVPVYRIEYIFGFVTGMTIAFGSVIPLAFSVVFAAISFVVRKAASLVFAAVRRAQK